MQQLLFKNLQSPCSILFKIEDNKLRVEIETERLYIRSYNEKDLNDCILLYGDPTITKHFDHGIPRTETEVKELIKDRGSKYFDNGEPFGLFSLFFKETGNFIGQADLFPTSIPTTLEIGCILQNEFQHQGLGTEAVKALIVDYINELNKKGFAIDTVMGTVHPENIASNKLVKKCGMKANKFQERFGNPRIWYYYKVDVNPK